MQKIKYFMKDYRLPSVSTAVYIFILLVFLLLRVHDHSILATVLSGKNSAGGDYANLLSKDVNEGFNKNSTEVDEAKKTTTGTTTPTTTTQTSTFTVSSSGSTATTTSTTTSGGSTTTSGGSTTTTPPPTESGGTSTSGGGTTTPPPPTTGPFSAAVAGVRYMGASSVMCNGGTGSTTYCFKRYYFGGDINTMNGPGDVKYMWYYSIGIQHADRSFTAPTGDATTSVSDVVEIPCSTPAGPVTLKLGVTSPTPNYKDFVFPHDCSTTSPPPTGP